MNKVALITGTGRGIGAATAILLTEPDRINRIKPSIPLKRGGKTEEVASAIAWLASDEASYVTGSFIDVSGGR